MSDFEVYFRMGMEHITDPGGFDHMLFLVVLCAAYSPAEWRRVLLLATAFTLGHSITLAITVVGGPLVPGAVVEALIPVTIFLTALLNLWKPQQGRGAYAWILAGAFGLVHGMGFAGYLRQLLSGIREDLWQPLLYFNLGLEAGQLVIVSLFMALAWATLRLTGLRQKWWTVAWSLAGAGLSLWLLYTVV